MKETKEYHPKSGWKAIITLLSPVIAPFYLFSKFMYKIKSIKFKIEYE